MDKFESLKQSHAEEKAQTEEKHAEALAAKDKELADLKVIQTTQQDALASTELDNLNQVLSEKDAELEDLRRQLEKARVKEVELTSAAEKLKSVPKPVPVESNDDSKKEIEQL